MLLYIIEIFDPVCICLSATSFYDMEEVFVRHRNASAVIFIIVTIVVFAPPSVGALQFWTIPEGEACGPGTTGIAINATSKEFYTSFASIFRLSDGSSIRPPPQERMESVRYMQELLSFIGVTVNETLSAASNGQYEGDVLQICGKDVVDLLLLGVVGNFVTNPGILIFYPCIFYLS